MYILTDLFYGRVDPSCRVVRRGSEYEQLSRGLSKVVDGLCGSLNEEQQGLFAQFDDLQKQLYGISEEDCFIRGFRIGARMMLDVFTEYRSQLPQAEEN